MLYIVIDKSNWETRLYGPYSTFEDAVEGLEHHDLSDIELWEVARQIPLTRKVVTGETDI